MPKLNQEELDFFTKLSNLTDPLYQEGVYNFASCFQNDIPHTEASLSWFRKHSRIKKCRPMPDRIRNLFPDKEEDVFHPKNVNSFEDMFKPVKLNSVVAVTKESDVKIILREFGEALLKIADKLD